MTRPRAISTAPRPDNRKRLIKLLHVAKRECGLDDDTYRDLIERAAGKRSAGDMDEAQLQRALDALKGAGFKPRRAAVKHRSGHHALITALWIDLWLLGAVQDRSDKALNAFIQRQAGVAQLRWLTPREAEAVIEALKDWCFREGLDFSKGIPDAFLAKRAVARAIYRKLIPCGRAAPFSPRVAAMNRMSDGELHELAWEMADELRSVPS